MGAAESQGVYSHIDLNHPALRNCQALTKNGITFLQASMTCQLPQYQQWKQEVKTSNLHQADTDYLLLPLKHRFQEGGVCSTAGELTIEYDYYPKLLSVQIRDRMKDKKSFTEAELWYLLYVMVSAREAMVLQGMEVGDIQPKNVFLNSNQQAKMACLLSWPGQISAYKRAVLEQGFEYLSPEDIVRLKLGAMDNKNNSESETFAMGLTLLSASCLQPMKDLYRAKERDIDQQLFGARLAIFQQDRHYSQVYRAIVYNLLEMDPMKRMNQEELGELLFKHRENLQNKKPLMFDNVGKKLQQSINNILKIAPQPLTGSAFRGSRANSKNSKDGQGSNQHINYQDLNQQPFRQSGTRSVQKSKTPIINFQFAGSGVKIPVSATQQRKIIFNNSSTGNIPPSVPLYMPPKPMNHIVEPSKAVEIYQTGSRAEPPKKVFRPFDHITPGSPKIGQIQQMVEESKVRQIVAMERGGEGEEKSAVTELMMQTRKGGFLVQMSKVERKDPKLINLDENSIIKDRKGSSILLENKQTKIQKLLDQKIEEKLSDKLRRIESSEEVLIIQNKEPNSVQAKSKSENKPEEPQSTAEEPKDKKNELEDKEPEAAKVIQNILEIHKPEKIIEKAINVDNKVQDKIETDVKVSAVQIVSVKEGQKNNSNAQSRVSNDSKASQTKYSPSVKIWGMQKGKLTFQEVNGSQPFVPKSNSNPSTDVPKTELVLPQIKPTPVQETTIPPSLQQNNPPIQDQSPPTPQEANPSPTQQPTPPQEKLVQEQSNYQAAPAAPTVTAEQTEKIEPGTPPEAVGQPIKTEPTNNDKYILIQQPSRATPSKGSELTEKQDSPKKTEEIVVNRNAQLSERGSPAHSRQRSGSFTRSNAAETTNFIFSEIMTDGTFEEGWEELMRSVKQPQLYSRIIKPQKVSPLENEYGQFLKVGPARMKVNLNKEQGKIWLQNLPSSLCEGDIFCGVVKKEDKQNYIWMNSSLTFKGMHFPHLEVIEEGLQVADKNIRSKHAE